MTWEPRIGPQGREDDLTRALRDLHAPPADPGYWRALEQRILARIEEEDGWWRPFQDWVRIGAAAAAVLLAVAGAALIRAHEAEQAAEALVAFERVIETPRSLPAQLATETGPSGREMTLQYLLEP